jgi:SsrA-binding protein
VKPERSPQDKRSKSRQVDIATNRKAPRDYHLLEKYEAGVELKGTEVKSIRAGHINLGDAFARIERGQAFLYGCDIRPYEKASHEQHEARRSRRLLLHKNEILKLYAASQQKGLTLVALRVYWKDKRVKIEIAVGKGKTQGDQRQDLKKKVENREAQREMARFNERGGK